VYQNVVRQFLPVCLILAQLLFLTGTSSAEETFAGLKFGVGLSLTLDTGKHDRIDTAEPDGNKIVRVIKEHNDIPRVLLETHYFFMPKKQFWLPFGSNLEPGEWGWGPFIGLEPGSEKVIKAIGGGLMVGFLRREKTNIEQKCENEAEALCKCTETDTKQGCEYRAKKACLLNCQRLCEKKAPDCPDSKKPTDTKSAATDNLQTNVSANPAANPPSDASCKEAVIKACNAPPTDADCKEVAASAKVKDSFNIGIGLMMDPSVKILGDGITENEPLPAGETTVRTKETSQWGVLFMVSYNF